MKIELTHEAGFPLFFDTEAMDLLTEEVSFIRQDRTADEMKAVILDPSELVGSPVLYWNFKLQTAGSLSAVLEQRRLTYSLVLLPPGKVGGEYNKTHGHYHSAIPGSQIGYPEVYTHFYGVLYLFMQRRVHPAGTDVDDCVLYKMVPGQSILIPPGYAHVLINPSGQPGLMAGLYSLDSIHDYQPVDRMAGGAYYFVEREGREFIYPNPRYSGTPPLRTLTQIEGTRFEPPDPRVPLWQSFAGQTEKYAFLYDSEAARQYFMPEDLHV